MKKWIALIALGASMLAVLATDAEAAEAASHRYCGTAADGFPGVIAVGPTTCGFARNVATTFDRKRVRLYQWRPHIWMPRPTWIRAWSSKMHRAYRMYCRPRLTQDSPFVSCTGGRGARVDLVS